MARPRITIDWKEVGKLAFLQCTQIEIAWFCDVAVNTLERDCRRKHKKSFGEFLEQKRGAGKIQLRKAQMQVAIENKNIAMLIFLGKQYLGQSDKVETVGPSEVGFEFINEGTK